jgi:hypothetical protein
LPTRPLGRPKPPRPRIQTDRRRVAPPADSLDCHRRYAPPISEGGCSDAGSGPRRGSRGRFQSEKKPERPSLPRLALDMHRALQELHQASGRSPLPRPCLRSAASWPTRLA